jgi:hypothetical protein
MIPFDLKDFAEHSQKLPKQLLSHIRPQKKPETLKLLLAHWIDFSLAMTATTIISEFYSQGIQTMMKTRPLESWFMGPVREDLFFSLVPFVIFNYFFFFYFMNHGQSWGMVLTKNRIKINERSFLAALQWASHSTLLCLSCGLWYVLKKPQWAQVKTHDYLYDELVAYKDSKEINLLKRIEEAKLKQEFREEEVLKAA